MRTRSRTLLTLAALTVLSVLVASVALLTLGDPSGPDDSGEPDESVVLSADPGSVVRSARVPLGTDRLHPVAGEPARLETSRLTSSSYRMVALTWRGDSGATLTVRTRADRGWSGWRAMPPLEDLPDAREDTGVRGTDLLWVGPSDGIQVRVTGAPPGRLALVLIDPGVLPTDATSVAGATAAAGSGGSGAEEEPTGAPRPEMRNRARWGADESWRDGGPWYDETVKQVHVHHTATGNNYRKADVPGLIRGMYRYHTHNLGWSDIGYNFLVDKWGRIWKGRYGKTKLVVHGAHTLGFNTDSVGVALIGNHQEVRPTDEALWALVRLAAWKLDMYGRRPSGKIKVRSEGSDKYDAGVVVRLPIIDGHRRTNDTACPGSRTVRRMAELRERAQRRADRH